MIKAVLFDMDGVLYDSMPFHTRAWTETADNYGLIASPEDFYLMEGRTGDATIDELFRRTFGRDATPEEKISIYKHKTELFNRYGDGRVMPGAVEVLAKARSAHLEIILVTGSAQDSLLDRLETDFPGYFTRDKMVTGFDVKYGKPHPEPYLMGLAKAGVQAPEAIVVENAPMGVESAVAAGIFTIAVNTGPLDDRILSEKGASLLYPDMPTLVKAWDGLIERLNNS